MKTVFCGFLLSVFIAGCTGSEGPQGTAGLDGTDCSAAAVATAMSDDNAAVQKISDDLAARHADVLGSPDTPEQVLDKLKQVDGPGSGLDADTLDGVHLSEITDQVSALEARIVTLEAKIVSLEDGSKEVLYAFDGENRLLGRVISIQLDSVVFFDKESGLPVEAFTEPLGQPETLQDTRFYYGHADCIDQTVNMIRTRSSKVLGVLENGTGNIYSMFSDQLQTGSFPSSSSLVDSSITCDNTPLSDEFYPYVIVRTISPYTPGIHVAPID